MNPRSRLDAVPRFGWWILALALAGCGGPSPAPPTPGNGLRAAGSALEKDLAHAEKLARGGAAEQAIPAFDRILKTVDLGAAQEIRALLGRCDAKLATGATAEAFADARSAESRWKSLRRRDVKVANDLAPELDRALGDCALFMKDASGARSRYEKALAKSERLVDADAVRFKLWLAASLARDSDAATLLSAVAQPQRADLADLAVRLGVSKGSSAVATADSPIALPSGGNALPGITVRPRTSWNARPPKAKDLEPLTRVFRITVHHSGEITNVGNETDVSNLLRAIQNTHQNGERYADIGYHFLIDAKGRVWQGRDLKYQGAHAGNGALNAGNVGVCLLGDFDKQSLPVAQAKSLITVLDALRKRYGVRRENIYGHGEIRKLGGIGGTECPGDRVQAVVANYRKGKT